MYLTTLGNQTGSGLGYYFSVFPVSKVGYCIPPGYYYSVLASGCIKFLYYELVFLASVSAQPCC